MGDINKSGPVKFLHMYADLTCDGFGPGDFGLGETGEAASIDPNPADPPCFMMEMGLQGAIAKDQDEVPIQLNIGATSQSSVLDCDPNIPNLKDEIVQGCGPDGDPLYAAKRLRPPALLSAVEWAQQLLHAPEACSVGRLGREVPLRRDADRGNSEPGHGRVQRTALR